MGNPISEKPTLRALIERRALQLRLVGSEDDLPAGSLDRALRWVHSSDLADPTPFLSEDLALLTTGTQFPDDDRVAYDAYVARLTTRGVLALGFGTEVVREGVPAALADACRRHGMPLFEVPYRTPFIAVARANAESVAAESYERRSWALAAQRALALAALRPDGLGATLAELSKQLGAWVGLFDAAGALTREHPLAFLDSATSTGLHAEVDAVLRRGARAGSSLRIGETAFSLQTLGRGGHLRGVLAIAAHDLDQEGRGVITAVVAMAGLALEQRQGFERSRTQFRSALVSSLLLDEPAFARRMARELFGGLPEAPVVVAVTDAAAARSHAEVEWLELRADERVGGLFFGRTDGGLILVAPADRADAIAEFADHFGERLGVSAPTGYDRFARAVQQARLARERGTGAVTRFDELAGSGVLALLESADARAIASATLEPLVEHDAENGTELVETLRAWLDGDCSLEACARTLGIHRHTARARVAQIERVLGTDLGSFAARAELWAAMVALS